MLEVLGSFVEEEVITVLIAEAWGFNWTIWTNGFSTEFSVVNKVHLVDVLAWIAIPKLVSSVLLPPFTVKTSKGSLWVNFRFWAVSWNWSESDTLVVHGAGKEFITGIVLISESAFGGAVLVVEFHWSSVVVVIWVASVLAPCLLHEGWINHSFGHLKWAF